ncbi:unnamed protein product [Discosporangium mesarthrocarpum]
MHPGESYMPNGVCLSRGPSAENVAHLVHVPQSPPPPSPMVQRSPTHVSPTHVQHLQQQQQHQQQGQQAVGRHHVWKRRGSFSLQAPPHPQVRGEIFPPPMGHHVVMLMPEDLEKEDLSGTTPGEALLKFLEYFGRRFDAGQFGISVGRGPLGNPFLLSKAVDPVTGMAVMDAHVVIEDPLDRGQNVARSCFAFPQVQWLFAQCLSILEIRGQEVAEYDPDADLLHLLLYF